MRERIQSGVENFANRDLNSQVQQQIDMKLAQLDYQIPQRKSHAALVLRLVVGVPILAVVGGCFSMWLYEATGDWRFARYTRATAQEMAAIQQHYLDRTYEPDFVAYEERNDYKHRFRKNGGIDVRKVLADPKIAGVILANDLKRSGFPWTDCFDDVTFSHLRNRPDGERRLVWCSTHPGGLVDNKRRVPLCYWVLSLAEPVYGSWMDLKPTRLGPRLELARDAVLTLFYGNADERDSSSFTFDYLSSGERGRVRGRLLDDDTIAWTHEFGPGKLVSADAKMESPRSGTADK